MKKLDKRNQNQNSKIQTLNSKFHSGITLIALVVTVVVLLILAGVTINLIFGENNIFDIAKDAADKTNTAIEDEKTKVEGLDTYVKDKAGSTGNSGGGSGGEENPDIPPTPEEPEVPKGPNGNTLVTAIEKDTTKNQVAEDKYGNKIVIPAGFTVVENSPEGTDEAEKVVYSYNGNGTPAVQDGIVVQDELGNQFVWVPVGTIQNKEGDTVHGETSTITLGRYDNFTANNKVYTPKQIAETQYKGTSIDASVDLTYQQTYKIALTRNTSYHTMELNTKQSGKNEVAKNLGDFITKTIANKGYYIARYEASGKTGGTVTSKANQTVWNEVDQATASSKSQSMYNSTNGKFESDLINNYSWDTAIIFIQTYSDENSNYANQGTKKSGSSPFSTGTSTDRACNIHDMASNCYEWSTEYSTCTNSNGVNPCVNRGGSYYKSSNITAYRFYGIVGYTNTTISFRPLLYCSTEP